jgi:hypothetical protein
VEKKWVSVVKGHTKKSGREERVRGRKEQNDRGRGGKE